MSKHNLTIYEGCPENKFGLWMLVSQRSILDGAHVCRVCWFCGKAQTQFTDIRTMFTHRVVCLCLRKNPAACEMRSAICFFNAKYMKPAENHCQLCDVYGEHAISSSVVQRWVRLYSEGHDNVHGDVRNGWLSVVNGDLVRAVEGKVRENTIHHYVTFPAFAQISWSLTHKIVSDKFKFQKLCAISVPKLLTEEHKLKRQASTLNFLTYGEEGEIFLSYVVTGNEIWV